MTASLLSLEMMNWMAEPGLTSCLAALAMIRFAVDQVRIFCSEVVDLMSLSSVRAMALTLSLTLQEVVRTSSSSLSLGTVFL